MNRKLQVFVSSTYSDLLEERQAAVQAILKAGHIPAGMELFAAGDKSQLETIYDWIDECDVYMLILGGRYGSVDPQSGRSYTELEYDYARSKGKPFFSVVINESALEKKVKDRGTVVIEMDNPSLLKMFRQKVLQSVSSFFDDIKDVKLTVYESLGTLNADRALSGWVSGRDVPDVISLKAEIDRLNIEKENLEKELSRKAKLKQDGNDLDYDLIERVLSGTVVKIPGDAFDPPKKSAVDISLQDFLIGNADALVTGVNNVNSSPYGKFLYFSIFPKLQVHGLADNEKPAGSSFRRSFLSKEGQKYVAWHQKKKYQSSK